MVESYRVTPVLEHDAPTSMIADIKQEILDEQATDNADETTFENTDDEEECGDNTQDSFLYGENTKHELDEGSFKDHMTPGESCASGKFLQASDAAKLHSFRSALVLYVEPPP